MAVSYVHVHVFVTARSVYYSWHCVNTQSWIKNKVGDFLASFLNSHVSFTDKSDKEQDTK